MSASYRIEFLPAGVTCTSNGELTLLELGRSLGLPIESSCGGRGGCRSCALRLEGAISAPTAGEREAFTPEELALGWRRACQTKPVGDCVAHLPARSHARSYSTGKEADGEPVGVEEPLWEPDAVGGLWRSGARVMDGSAQGGPLALAVDLGTTNLALSLLDLASRRVVGFAGQTNPQVAFGADLISRLGYALRSEGHARELQQAVVEALSGMALALAGEERRRIVEMAVVGNTVMQHLFLGLPIQGLARAPFSPAALEAVTMPAAALGFDFAPQAQLYVAPNVAGFIGGDHLAALLDVTASYPRGRWAMLDIGTNTEIALYVDGAITSVSCASGPAFEGGKLMCGMRAAPGAIDRVRINGAVELSTIEGQPAIGICGSGVLSATAALRRAGLVDARGRMQLGSAVLRERAGSRELVLWDEQRPQALPIVFTQGDVRSVQLAKGAVRAGLEMLLTEAGLGAADLDRIVIAGAFGSFVDVDDAVTIGLLPDLPRERILQVGNSAGVGARRLAACGAARRRVAQMARAVRYLELASAPAFQKVFLTQTML